MKTISRDLQTLFGVGVLGALTDGQLLDRFLARREEAVFEEMVRRHGPMVWGACRRVLNRHHDAEDAFQATFLVLARKGAAVVPRDRLGNWLYGVAFQTALKARAAIAKRAARERSLALCPEPRADRPGVADELDLAWRLDLELRRLPEKYRAPIVLCDLEGASHQEAADRLGWPLGTVSGRLSKARALLLQRLRRHERLASLSGAALTLALAREASAGVPTSLVHSTVKVVVGRAIGGPLELVSDGASALTQRVLTTMALAELKRGVGVLTAAVVGCWLALQGVHVGLAETSAALRPFRDGVERLEVGPAATPQADLERLQGVWFGTLVEASGPDGDGSSAVPPQVRLIVTGDRFSLRGPRFARTVTFGVIEDSTLTVKLDVGGDRRLIDLTVAPAGEPPLIYRGIYSLASGRFRLCLDLPGRPRPESFQPRPRSSQLLFEFKPAVINDSDPKINRLER